MFKTLNEAKKICSGQSLALVLQSTKSTEVQIPANQDFDSKSSSSVGQNLCKNLPSLLSSTDSQGVLYLIWHFGIPEITLEKSKKLSHHTSELKKPLVFVRIKNV